MDEITIIDPKAQVVEDYVTTELAKFDKFEARCNELEALYGGITINGVDDREGYAKAKEAVRELRTGRTATEKERKRAKALVLEAGRRIDNRAEQITGIYEALENPIKKQIQTIDDEKDKLDAAKKQQQDTQLKDRTKELLEMGAVFNGVDYVLEDVTYSLSIIREVDQSVYEASILPQYTAIWTKKEELRKEQEKIDRDAEEKRQEDARKLKEQNDELERKLKQKQDEEEKTKQEKVDKRIAKLEGIGLHYNRRDRSFGYYSVVGECRVPWNAIENFTDDEWEKSIALIEPEAKNLMEFDEEKKREKIRQEEADKLKKQQDDDALRKKQAEDEAEQKRQDELDAASDKTKWANTLDYLKATPIHAMRSGQYRAKMKMVHDFIDDLN